MGGVGDVAVYLCVRHLVGVRFIDLPNDASLFSAFDCEISLSREVCVCAYDREKRRRRGRKVGGSMYVRQEGDRRMIRPEKLSA